MPTVASSKTAARAGAARRDGAPPPGTYQAPVFRGGFDDRDRYRQRVHRRASSDRRHAGSLQTGGWMKQRRCARHASGYHGEELPRIKYLHTLACQKLRKVAIFAPGKSMSGVWFRVGPWLPHRHVDAAGGEEVLGRPRCAVCHRHSDGSQSSDRRRPMELRFGSLSWRGIRQIVASKRVHGSNLSA